MTTCRAKLLGHWDLQTRAGIYGLSAWPQHAMLWLTFAFFALAFASGIFFGGVVLFPLPPAQQTQRSLGQNK
eukprot:5189203-Amphidinium_carterae.1